MPVHAIEPPVLEVADLSVSYAGRKGLVVEALDGVSFKVAPGEFVAVIGASGCGKSTLLKAIAGLLSDKHQVSGEVRNQAGLSLGYLFQRETLLPWRTVLDNVAVPLEAQRIPKIPRRQRARCWLKRLGLAGEEKRFPHELSGGQRQRALLARTLVYGPDVILLDEPLGSLDALARTRMQDVLLGLHRTSKQAFVLVTHDLDEALALADRVVLLAGQPGRVYREYPVNWRHSDSVLTARMAAGYAELQRRLWLDLEVEHDAVACVRA